MRQRFRRAIADGDLAANAADLARLMATVLHGMAGGGRRRRQPRGIATSRRDGLAQLAGLTMSAAEGQCPGGPAPLTSSFSPLRDDGGELVEMA
jgi:hypothetical protein